MKYLNDYTQKAQTKLFELTGSFFAFSQAQFNEAKKTNLDYADMGSGLFCDSTKTQILIDGLKKINSDGIIQDMAENGAEAIIWREFANYECQIGMNFEDATNALKDYPISLAEIKAQWKPYFDNCVKMDYF
jgi:hypothetical protein